MTRYLRDDYPGGECPDCNEPITEDMVNGGECANCGHVFWRVKRHVDCDCATFVYAPSMGPWKEGDHHPRCPRNPTKPLSASRLTRYDLAQMIGKLRGVLYDFVEDGEGYVRDYRHEVEGVLAETTFDMDLIKEHELYRMKMTDLQRLLSHLNEAIHNVAKYFGEVSICESCGEMIPKSFYVEASRTCWGCIVDAEGLDKEFLEKLGYRFK